MNIVFLTGPYFPDMSPVGACMDKYIQVLKNRHNIDVICERNRYNTSGFCDSLIKLHQVDNWWMRLRVLCEHKLSINKRNYYYKFLLSALRAYGCLIAPFSYPTRMSWLKRAYVKEFEAISKYKHIDVVISSHYPICTMFAGMIIKRTNPDIRWITFFTDPFAVHEPLYKGVIFKSLRRKRFFRSEREIYETADYNFFTEELYQHALNVFQQPVDKTICMKYIISNLRKQVENSYRVKESNDARLVFAGCFYRVIRNPEYMLSELSKVEGVKFDIYKRWGDCEDIIERYRSEKISDYPAAPRLEYLDIICNRYDILVSLGNDCELQAPSKTLELISTGLPIIHFYFREDRQMKMLKQYPLGLVIKVGTPDMSAKITEFCKQMKGKRISFEEVLCLYPENSLDCQIKLLESKMAK